MKFAQVVATCPPVASEVIYEAMRAKCKTCSAIRYGARTVQAALML